MIPVLGTSLQLGLALTLAVIGGLGGILGGAAALLSYWNNRELNEARTKREEVAAGQAALDYEANLLKMKEDCQRQLEVERHYRREVGEPAEAMIQQLQAERAAGIKKVAAADARAAEWESKYRGLLGLVSGIVKHVQAEHLVEAQSLLDAHPLDSTDEVKVHTTTTVERTKKEDTV